MKTGACPKCGSKSVYKKVKGISFGDGGSHVYTQGVSKPTPVENYICSTCGYFEGYLADKAKLEAVQQTWDKVDEGAC